MNKLQFRVLCREFLFRMVDLEVLSPQGDISTLLGQFAGLLAFVGAFRGLVAMFIDPRSMPERIFRATCWNTEHLMISLTMLVVGLFAVLSWDSTFLDRRDVMVLAPLPIRTRMLFLAKIAAVAGALGITIVALNAPMSLVWPVVLAPPSDGILELLTSPSTYRAFGSYWVSVIAGGAFIYCSVLGVQGLAAQLPRRWFLRFSAFLQLAAFGLFVSVWLLEPNFSTPQQFADPRNQRLLTCLPSYWFFGLFHFLNGSMRPALEPLVPRAWMALGIALASASTAFLFSYFRSLRRIVEEPDILPTARRRGWAPRFGNALQTAVVQFALRTMLRSRQHRVILAFYLGLGFAIVSVFLRFPGSQAQMAAYGGLFGPRPNVQLLISSVVMLCFCLLGTRVVFSMPLELRANWIFRITPIRGAHECLAATRRALLVLAVAPVSIASGAVILWLWPWPQALGHAAVLALLGVILVDLSLIGFQKIPFTCSYLPGQSKLHMKFWYGAVVLLGLIWAAEQERRALEDPVRSIAMLAAFALAAALIRRRTTQYAPLLFEEEPTMAVYCLNLHRDGHTVIN
jgi:hypothetical protein